MTEPADRLQAALTVLRWPYATLGAACGVTPTRAWRWLNDARYPPPLAILERLEEWAAFIGASPLPQKPVKAPDDPEAV